MALAILLGDSRAVFMTPCPPVHVCILCGVDSGHGTWSGHGYQCKDDVAGAVYLQEPGEQPDASFEQGYFSYKKTGNGIGGGRKGDI